MDTGDCRGGRLKGGVEHKVTHLSEEVILVRVPVRAIATGNIWVGIKHPVALTAVKAGSCLNCGWVDCIANQLSVVVHLDGLGDTVSAWREVD